MTKNLSFCTEAENEVLNGDTAWTRSLSAVMVVGKLVPILALRRSELSLLWSSFCHGFSILALQHALYSCWPWMCAVVEDLVMNGIRQVWVVKVTFSIHPSNLTSRIDVGPLSFASSYRMFVGQVKPTPPLEGDHLDELLGEDVSISKLIYFLTGSLGRRLGSNEATVWVVREQSGTIIDICAYPSHED